MLQLKIVFYYNFIYIILVLKYYNKLLKEENIFTLKYNEKLKNQIK